MVTFAINKITFVKLSKADCMGDIVNSDIIAV